MKASPHTSLESTSRRALRRSFAVGALSGAALLSQSSALGQQIGDVFYIALENHNWTQPNGNVTAPGASSGTLSSIQQIFGNSAAPFINSLVTPGNPNAAQTSYASAYYNVLSTPSGSNPAFILRSQTISGMKVAATSGLRTTTILTTAPTSSVLLR